MDPVKNTAGGKFLWAEYTLFVLKVCFDPCISKHTEALTFHLNNWSDCFVYVELCFIHVPPVQTMLQRAERNEMKKTRKYAIPQRQNAKLGCSSPGLLFSAFPTNRSWWELCHEVSNLTDVF